MKRIGWCAFLVLLGSFVVAEEPNEKAAKYHELLTKRPSGGYLFDRFYSAWLDTGTLDGLEAYLKDGDPLLLAYYYAKQGEDGKALQVFDEALKDGGAAEAWLEKAKIHARTMAFEEAVTDLDSAAAADPKIETAIEIGKLKGRILLRSGKTDDALTAWRDLLAKHPEDEELFEDLIDLQANEGAMEEAINSAKALVERTADPYLKVTRQLRLGDLYQRAGNRDAALEIYTKSLEASGQGSWLEKEVLSQIEQVFRREDNVSGLKAYLIKLSEEHPQRVGLLKRQARVHGQLAETDEAIETFRKILQLTPGDRANREAFVDLLGRLERYETAVEQMQALVDLHPDDGELLAQLAMRQHAAKQADAAEETALKYLEQSDKSEYSYLRAARLLEQFERSSAATDVYAKLSEAFPDSVGVREAQASFLHRDGKKEASVAAWKAIAETGTGLDAIRAAKALSSYGDRETAFEILKGRVDDFGTDFLFLGQLCTEAAAVEKFDEAVPWIESRIILADTPTRLFEAIRQAVSIVTRIENPDEWREALATKSNRCVNESCLLAELFERNGDFDKSEATLAPHVEAEDVFAISQRVRLLEMRNLWNEAAETQQLLVEAAGGRTSTNLRKIVDLYQRALEYDEALKWVEAWKRLSPGSASPWREEAAVFVAADRMPNAIETLRRAAQRFEDDPSIRATLAQYYEIDGKLNDAERIYWTLYEEQEDLNAKLKWVGELARMAQTRNRQDRLLEQFEERRQNNRTSVAPLFALAEIHRQLENYEERRTALMEATRLRPDDVKLFFEIARIEEEAGDWEQSMETLERAASLDSSTRARRQIARLNLLWGDGEEGMRQMLALASDENAKPREVLGMADSIIAFGDWEAVAEFLTKHEDRFPNDFRFPYLRGIALLEAGQYLKATEALIPLLSWEHELPNPPTNSQNQGINWSEYYGDIPEDAKDLMLSSWNVYTVFQYRQQLQQARQIANASYFYSSGGRFVTLPKELKEARDYAMTVLRVIAKDGVDEVDTGWLSDQLLASGTPNAAILLGLPASTDFGNTEVFPRDLLLEQYPDHEGLATMGVLWQTSHLYENPSAVDGEVAIHAHKLLHEDYPHLGLASALVAAVADADDESRGAQLLEQELARDAEFSGNAGLTMQIAMMALGSQFNEIRQPLVAERFRRPIFERIVKWHRAQLEEIAQKPQLAQQSFYPYDSMGSVYRLVAEPDQTFEYFESEIARYEQFNHGNVPDFSGLATYYNWAMQQQPMLSPFSFPPMELPDFPANVLTHFVQIPQYQQGTPFEADYAARALEEIKNPILKVLAAHTANDAGGVAEGVQQLLDGEPGVRELVLAASYYQSQEEYERVIELLERASKHPMTKALRRRIDGALVATARDMDVNEGAVIEAAKRTALRMRFGARSPDQRAELVAALEHFGLDREAEMLEARSSASVASNRSSSFGVRQVASPQERDQEKIQQAINRGDNDEAVDISLKNLRPAARSIAAAGPSVAQVNYQLTNFISNSGLMSIADEIIAAVDEPDSLRKRLELAALLELVGRPIEAADAYEAALEEAGSNYNGLRMRLIVLRGADDPEAGLRLLLEADKKMLRGISAAFESVTYQLQYTDRGGVAAVRFNLAEMTAMWLEQADLQLLKPGFVEWADQEVLQNLQNQMYLNGSRLGDPYLRFGHVNYRTDSNGASPDFKKVIERRAEVSERMNRAMMRVPHLCRDAFDDFASLALSNDPGDDVLAELDELAREVIGNFDQGTGAGVIHFPNPIQTNYRRLTNWFPEEYLIWRADSREAAEDVLAMLEDWSDAGLVDSATTFANLRFGEPDEFKAGARQYLTVGLNPPHYQGHTYPENMSRADKVFHVWKQRYEELPLELSEFILTQFKLDIRTSRHLTTLADDYLVWLTENGRYDDAAEFLEQLTVAALGEREKWDRFVKPADRRTSQGYYMSGEWTTHAHREFAAFLTRCGWRPELVFLVSDLINEGHIDDNQQISSETMIASLDSSRLRKDVETVLALMRSAAVAQRDGFSGLSRAGSNDSGLHQILKMSRNRQESLAALEGIDSFGSGLMRAYFEENQQNAVSEYLGKHRAVIEAFPVHQLTDLDAFLEGVLNNQNKITNTDTSAVLQLLKQLRDEEALADADRFLEMKRVEQTGATRESQLDPYVFAMLHSTLTAGDREKATRVFWHAVELVAKEQKMGNWDAHWNGWTYPADLLHDFCSQHPGGGLERFGFVVHLLRADAETQQLPHSGWQGGYQFGTALTNVYENESLEAMFQQLQVELGEGDASIMLSPFYEFIDKLPRNQRVKVIQWAIANSDDKLINELAMTGRFYMAANVQKAGAANVKKIDDLDAWQTHYLSALNDDNLGLIWRISISTLLTFKAPHLIQDEIAHRSGEIVAEAMNRKIVFNGWHLAQIIPEFLSLERDERWIETATALSDGWKVINRNNHLNTRTGRAFNPVSDAVMPFFGLHVKLGDEERHDTFIRDWLDDVDESARALWLCVMYGEGEFETARRLLDEGWEEMDVLEFRTSGTFFAPRYSELFDQQLQTFFASVDDPGKAVIAELLLKSAPDPPLERRKAAETFDLKHKRLATTAKRFSDVEFESEGVRKRALVQLASNDAMVFANQKLIVEAFNAADDLNAEAIIATYNQNLMDAALRIPMAHGLIRAKQGDAKPLIDLVEQIQDAKPMRTDAYYRRQALSVVAKRVTQRIKSHSRNFEADEVTSLCEVVQSLIAAPQGRQYFSDMGKVYTALISLAALHALDLKPWREGLSEGRTNAIKSSFGPQPHQLWVYPQQMVQALGANPAPLEQRKTITIAVLSDLAVQEAYKNKHRDFFRQISDKKLMTIEEMLESSDELIEAWPRGGWAEAELAKWAADAGDDERALQLLDSAIARDPDQQEFAKRKAQLSP